jgi:hypothetical protein
MLMPARMPRAGPAPGSPQYSPPGSPQYSPPGSPQYSPPGSPQYSPPGSPQYSPPGSPDHEDVERVRRNLGLDFMVMPASMPPIPLAPGSPRPPQYSPPLRPRSPTGALRAAAAAAPAAVGAAGAAAARGPSGALAAAPASLEALDAEQLEGLKRDVRAALARVELAQEHHKAWEAVGKGFKEFCCPISGEPMREPVMLSDGTSYEKKAIKEWFRRQQHEGKPFSSPMTRALVSSDYVVNLSLKNAIAGAVEAKLAKLRKRKRQRECQRED